VLLQFGQQPAFLQGRLALTPTQRTVQHQGFGFPQRPYDRLHRVPAQLFQGRDAPVPVDDPIATRLIRYRHHHNRRLLARGRQRCQQPTLPLGPASPQMLPAPIELMKLQLHRQFLCDSES